jgi:RecB family exonuclease
VSEYEVSNTEIKTFRACRRKWWITYVLKLRQRDIQVVGPLPLGSRIHKALELYYRGDQGLMDAHEDLVKTARVTAALEGMDTSKLDEEAELGRLMLEGYLQWAEDEGIDANLEVIGVEEVLKYPMLRGAVTLIGKLDLRVVNKMNGMRSVLDFKTAANFNEFHLTGHMNPQLKTYQMLDALVNPSGVPIEGGIYRLLKKVKRTGRATPPFYEDISIRHNKYTLRSFWEQLQGVLIDMVNTRNALLKGGDPMVHAYPNPTRDCTWMCPFITVCPMFDDGSDVESALNDRFETYDPYGYYGDSDGDAAEIT